MSNNLISVIIPVYNTETYLAPCLDSVLEQSYRNLEIIVINDGSTDFSLEILQKYSEKDDRIKFYNHDNEGLSVARNRGLDLATGDYITFLDSDDMLLPRSLEVMVKMIEKYSVDIVEGRVIRGKTHGNISPPKIYHPKVYSSQEAISRVLYQKELLPSACGKLYKTSLFDNLRFEKGIIYEDLDIFYKLYDKAIKILWIDFPVYFYRDTDGSIINTWKIQRLDVLKVTERLEEYIKEKYPDLLPAAKDRRLSANFNMYSLCSLYGETEKANECWEVIKSHRKISLFNSKVRLKNKAGILLSYLGKNFFKFFAKIKYL